MAAELTILEVWEMASCLVAHRLPKEKVTLEWPNNICVLVNERSQLMFGTNNEFICADLDVVDENGVWQYNDFGADTSVRSDEQDPRAVAFAIVHAVEGWKLDQRANATVDLYRIAELVREAGYVAYVEYTGGGCATIYASRWADERGYPATHYVGPYNDEITDVAVGPGSFLREGGAVGHLSELYIGDGAGEDPDQQYVATLNDTEQTLAAQIISRLESLPRIDVARPAC